MARRSTELTAEQWLELANRFYAESLKLKKAGATAEEFYKIAMYKRSAEAAERVAVRTKIEEKRKEYVSADMEEYLKRKTEAEKRSAERLEAEREEYLRRVAEIEEGRKEANET